MPPVYPFATAGNDDIAVGGNVDWTIDGDAGNDVILVQGIGNDTIDGGSGADNMRGGAGNDLYLVDDLGDVVVESVGGGTDTVDASVSYTLSLNIETLLMTGTAIFGVGNALNNTIIGNGGDNTINGGLGDDSMDGGTGNDTFFVSSALDVINETSSTATEIDTVVSTVTFDLSTSMDFTGLANNFLENLTLTGTAAINGTGNGVANVLIGNTAANVLDAGIAIDLLNGDGNDTMDGGAGADVMIGRDGDDTYFVNAVGDVVTEVGGEGSDTVKSTITYTMGLNVENLVLLGTAAINGTTSANGGAILGNSARNILTGSAADDILNGAGGADTMRGNDGNDIYFVDAALDVILESAGEGTDEVITSSNYTLGANIENLTLSGTAISGTGNAEINLLVGNSSDNTLDGLVGADTMVGGDGDDTFNVDDSFDVVDEILAQGTDTVRSSIDYTLTTFVENLVLTGTADIDGTGNAVDNTITGNSGDNVLDGLAGVDTLIGGAGDDSYVVDDPADVVTELLNQGTDTVTSDISYVLGDNVENLTLLGTNDLDGTGNSLNNTIIGNDGNNTLDGGAGADSLQGGLGDDTYLMDSASDILSEAPGEGTDTVVSSITYTLGTEFENLTLIGVANINGTGNASVNTIIGNSGNNILNGLAGSDTMDGGDGNDTYFVDAAGDTVIENPGAGTDTVSSSVDFDLSADGINVENLTLTGGALVGTGENNDNTITGNAGLNTLTGLDGEDYLDGGAAADTLDGGLDDDYLDGGAGADTMTGGLGDDTFIVDDALDVVNENAAEGTDSVFFSTAVAGTTFVIGADVENLTLLGTNNIHGTGNGLDNVITGNSGVNTLIGAGGNDTLNGGAGADSMDGGLGDDTFIVDNTADAISDAGGNDTIQTNATFNLLTNGMGIENLTLLGAAAINGTGDNSTNVITGNAANNILTGLGGNDTLSGGGGLDTMLGGLGDDLFIVDSSTDVVTELTGQGTDEVQTSATYTLTSTVAANSFVENLTLTGVANINGTGNTLVNTLTGNTGNNTLDGGTGADLLVGGDGDDTFIVDDLGDTVTELAGEGNDTVRSSVAFSLAALPEIENLTLTGTANISGTGNTGNNTFTGNTGINTFMGGDGDDTYIINSNDTAVELAGQGTDTLIVTITTGSYTVPSNFENIILVGTGNVSLTGDGSNNTLSGNNGNNTLDGGGGADTLSGGKGVDVYIVDDPLDVIIENAGEGTDTIRSSIDFTLAANVEHLVLTGVGNIDGTGNGGDNTITGNAGNNTLDGGLGTDRLIGGLGDDSYVVDNNRDVIVDSAGHDTVYAAYNYTLAAPLEDLVLTGIGNLNGTGNGVGNAINGNAGDNILTGLAGNDVLVGGDGDDDLIGGLGQDTMTGGDDNDSYVIDNVGDVVVELAGEGTDIVVIGVSYVFDPTAEIELITMNGTNPLNVTATDTDNFIVGTVAANRISALDGDDFIVSGNGADSIDAGLGNDIIFGGAGQDTMRGGDGADTFVIESFTGAAIADIIQDFDISTDNDVLDISDMLGSYDPLNDVLTDFVRILDSGGNSLVQVDANGGTTPGVFVTVAILQGINGLTGEQALVDSGNLIVS